MNDTIETRWEQENEAGRLAFTDGDFARAEQSFLAAIREATKLGADNVRLASSLSNLGQLKYKQKDFAQAEALFHRALAIRERVLGPDHFGLVQNINNLAALHYARNELDEAEPLFQRALSISQQHLGEAHPDVAVTLNNLARLYFRRNEYASAGPLLQRLLTIKEQALGVSHPEIAAIVTSLAKVRLHQQDYDGGEAFARRALEIREKLKLPNDLAVATALEALAEISGARGNVDEEIRHRERALEVRTGAMGADNPIVVAARAALEARRAGASAPVAAPAPIAAPAPAAVAKPAAVVSDPVSEFIAPAARAVAAPVVEQPPVVAPKPVVTAPPIIEPRCSTSSRRQRHARGRSSAIVHHLATTRAYDADVVAAVDRCARAAGFDRAPAPSAMRNSGSTLRSRHRCTTETGTAMGMATRTASWILPAAPAETESPLAFRPASETRAAPRSLTPAGALMSASIAPTSADAHAQSPFTNSFARLVAETPSSRDAVAYEAPAPTHQIEEPRTEISLDWPIEPQRPWLEDRRGLAVLAVIAGGGWYVLALRRLECIDHIVGFRHQAEGAAHRREDGHDAREARLRARGAASERRQAGRHERDHPHREAARRGAAPAPATSAATNDEGPPRDAKNATHVTAKSSAFCRRPGSARGARDAVDQGRRDHEHDRRQRAPSCGFRRQRHPAEAADLQAKGVQTPCVAPLRASLSLRNPAS